MELTAMSFQEAKAICIVGDRVYEKSVEDACRELGGGWIDGLNFWLSQKDAPYLILAAFNPLRVVKRAPLILVARDAHGLRHAAQIVCDNLDGVTCAWIHVAEKQTLDIVNPIVLADIETEGNA